MSSVSTVLPAGPGTATQSGISPMMTALLAASSGLIAAGSYFAQPLTGVIGPQLGLAPWMAGLIVTVSQLGYCLGLLTFAPLGDLLENRRLLFCTLLLSALSLGGAALAPDGAVFLTAAFGIGLASTAVQMIVTFAAVLSDPATRGRTVGNVTSGLLIGILLAWPVASLAVRLVGWRALFGVDAIVVMALAFTLRGVLPRRQPVTVQRYAPLVRSLWSLLRTTPELRWRAATQALLFATFSLFWTAAPLELSRHYALGPTGIALFGLAGAGGALAAPFAGRLADKGLSRMVSLAGIAAVVLAFVLVFTAGQLWLLGLAAIALNAGVQANHVISQRAILSLRPEAASRLNSLYIAIFFLGGAGGSAIAAPLNLIGWHVLGAAGAGLSLGALGLWVRYQMPAAMLRQSAP